MDILKLPVVTTRHSLRDAIEGMQRTDRRAVVVLVEPDEPYLCTNREVAAAWLSGIRKCSDLVPMIRANASMARLPQLERRVRSGSSLEVALDQDGRAYGLLELQSSGEAAIATIVTRYERLGETLRNGTKVCMCSGPREHQQESPPAYDGQPCQDCSDGVYICF